jgi:hypothetical protein
MYNTNDKKSVSSKLSSVSNASSARKCSGDFCSYSMEDEYHIIELENDFQLKKESLLAKERHRRLTAEEENELNEGDMLKGDDDDFVIADIVSSVDTGTKTTFQKISLKSIMLARDEMSMLSPYLHLTDINEINFHTASIPWPETTKHWWLRVGHSLIPSRRKMILPIGSEYNNIENSKFIKNSYNKNTVIEKRVNQTKNIFRQSKSAPILSNNTIESKKIMTLNTINENTIVNNSTSSNNINNKLSDRIPYTLSETNYESPISSLGHVSWYYSSTYVCHQCYLVYNQINKYRDKYNYKKNKKSKKVNNPFLLHLKSVSSISLQSNQLSYGNNSYFDNNNNIDNYDDQMTITQRKLIDRLSKAKQKVDEVDSKNQYKLTNSNNLINNTKRNNSNHSSNIGAPITLPPLPWQLHDHAIREKYELHDTSTFIKSIRTKAQQVAILAQQEKLRDQVSL